MQVASFPWDPPPPAPAPAPAAPPAAVPPPTTAAPAASAPQAAAPSYTQAQLSPTPNTQSLPLANGLPAVNGHQIKSEPNASQDATVKQEPGLANNGAAPPQFGAGGPQSVAAQRAMSQLQNQYGSRAAASISAIQGYGQGAQAGQGQQPAVAPRPPTGGAPAQQGARPPQAAQYSQQMAAQTAANLQQQQQQQQRPGQPPAQFPGQRPGSSSQNGFQQSQVDGAGDGYEGVLLRRDENGNTTELGRVEVDRILHQHIAARAKEMEGGGLMLPLKEATKHKSIAHKSGPAGASGFDGVDDELKREDPLDEEAINSDLDDPDEVDIAEEDDDENITQVMLCMYDKVQRVKNKWYALFFCLLHA